MRRLLPLGLLFASVLAHAEIRDWTFRVWLDDREIGRHRYTVEAEGDARVVRSSAQYDVRVLFFDAYRYRHEARERWDGRCLRSLVSSTDDNGERQAVSAVTRGGHLEVERTRGREAYDGCVMSFAYWDPRILAARRLLNSQTGELVPVTVELRGEQTIESRGKPQHATRYRLQAPDLEIDLWYAGDRWIALEALVAGGRRLRYELMGGSG